MEWIWAIPLAGIIVSVLVYSLGRIDARIGVTLSVIGIGISFGLFWPLMLTVLDKGSIEVAFTWVNISGLHLTWGIVADPLSIIMVGLVTFSSLGIQIYSWSYMRGDPRIPWYFTVQSLFASSMVILVFADNLLFLYIFWEIVGLCSYLLIGFWYERRSAAEAAKKAFITTRLGDVGLLIGIILLFSETGTFNIQEIVAMATSGELSKSIGLVSSCMIFLGAMGKSAQFPFHVWLPDAMEGPTPVSALIHAATMVVAGIYLVARLFPLFTMNESVMALIAVVGVFSALMGATIAVVMTDLKRILAYSTITDLGFMFLALGSGSVTAAMLHLITHAFAKATLFLSAGSISHATNETDIDRMGGLWKQMPLTALVFGIAALSLAGIPPLSGFFSKDEVLSVVHHGQGSLFLGLALIICFLKAWYMGRCFFKIFLGQLSPTTNSHDPPITMATSMSIFALLATVLGLLALDLPGPYNGFGSFLYGIHPEIFRFNAGMALLGTGVAAGGLWLAWSIYFQKLKFLDSLWPYIRPIHRTMMSKYYVDQTYQWVINQIILAIGKSVALVDRTIVNDIGVDGTADAVTRTGNQLTRIQSGKTPWYALAIILGIAILCFIWWITS